MFLFLLTFILYWSLSFEIGFLHSFFGSFQLCLVLQNFSCHSTRCINNSWFMNFWGMDQCKNSLNYKHHFQKTLQRDLIFFKAHRNRNISDVVNNFFFTTLYFIGVFLFLIFLKYNLYLADLTLWTVTTDLINSNTFLQKC